MIDVLRAIFEGWFAEPVPLIAAAAAVVLYQRGAHRLDARGSDRTPTTAQKTSLAVGVGIILVALLSPIDVYALQLQWVHMTQHVLVLLVAPPLIVLARPWDTAAAGCGPRLRKALAVPARVLSTHGRNVVAATSAVVLFVGVMWTWHIPALYDLTLRNDAVHNLEHTTFLTVGLLFWTAALPLRAGAQCLGMIGRAVVVLSGMIGSWLLAVYIGYATVVLYAYSGSGGMSALTDQQFASGVMWVPASGPFLVVLIVLIANWFEADARAAATELRQRSEAGA